MAIFNIIKVVWFLFFFSISLFQKFYFQNIKSSIDKREIQTTVNTITDV